MSKTLTIGAIAIILLALTLVGLLLWNDVRNQVSHTPASEQQTPPPPPAPSPILPLQVEVFDASNWQTYRNYEFGLELKYLKGIKIIDKKEDMKIGEMGGGFMPFCWPEKTILCLILEDTKAYDNTNFEGAGLSADSLGDRNTEASCLEPLDGSSQVTIGGVVFLKSRGSDGATGHVQDAVSYRAFYKQRCWDLRVALNSSNADRVPTRRALSEQERNQLFAMFDQILSTFRFVE